MKIPRRFQLMGQTIEDELIKREPETIFDIAYWQEETLKARRDFEKLQAAILDYFNDYDIHPYSAGLDDVWPLAKIKVNEKKNGWELVKK